MKTTGDKDKITWPTLQEMIQVSIDGRRDSLGKMIEGAIQQCVAASTKHMQGASLTLKLDFKIEEGMIDVYADLDTKLPKYKPTPARLYGTRQGELFADDPDQVAPLFPPQPRAVEDQS